MVLDERQQMILQALRRSGRLSRWELHENTGIRPNTVGSDVAILLEEQIVHECAAEAEGRGRPRVPLEIDTERRHVVGLAIRPGRVDVSRLNLLGGEVDAYQSRQVSDPSAIAVAARDLLRQSLNERTLSVGLSTPGFVDPVGHTILFSSAMRGDNPITLEPVYECAADLPLALENDMHALAARWLLTHEQDQDEDVLLVYFEDGQLGAAILINGRPNRGCVIGGNELGHTRLPVETERCYCGHVGCLERIVSTPFLKKQNGGDSTLGQRVATYNGTDTAMKRMIELLAIGLGNAVNFTRPNRLVLVSDLVAHEAFAEALVQAIRPQLFNIIAERVQIEMWQQAATNPAVTAGWLALANFYYQGWDQPKPEHEATAPA